MNKNINKELLLHIYKDASMGVKTMTDLSKVLISKNNKIKNDIENILKGYEKFLKHSDKLMKDYKVEKEETSFLADVGVKMNISMEMMKDNSDSRVANMIIQGLNMGIISMTKKIDDYNKKCDKEILNLAKTFLKYQNENLELLKIYL